MEQQIKLSTLVSQIQDTIQGRFEGETYWVSAQITNVKNISSSRRCYLTLEEYENNQKIAEARAVFWANCYHEIEKFEKITKQVFRNGIEIICKVKVRFHAIYGLNFDVLQIDVAHTLGSIELARQATLAKLVAENPKVIQFFDGHYRTLNNTLQIPLLIKNVALITAPDSDGQRDFLQELSKNKHGYKFIVTEYLTTIQGDNAHKLILDQLKLIGDSKNQFDVVAIVRGGGSQTDFKPFNDYDLAKNVANFAIPVFTGIGHDRNQSIVDLMARELKTPTKVASLLIEINFEFENRLIELKNRFFESVSARIEDAKYDLDHAKKIVKLSSPQAILNRGFAIVLVNDQIITDPASLKKGTKMQTLLKNDLIESTISNKRPNEKGTNI
jgi:exodeoxyribonuclease VII large subunit